MLKFKNLLIVLLCVCIVMLNVPYLVNVKAEAKVVQTHIAGKVNMNLNTDGSKMLDTLQKATLDINNVTFSNNELNLTGSVTYNGASYPIEIASPIYKSISSTNTIVGNAVDKSQNFDVINLSISNKIVSKKLLVNQLISNSNVIQVYLLRKGTRELSMFEFSTKDIPVIKNYFDNLVYDNLPTINDVSKDKWWITLFTPSVTSSEPENSIMSFSAPNGYTYTNTYTYYNGPNNCYKYQITLNVFATVYNYDGASPKTDTFGMRVISQNEYYNGILQQTPYNYLYVFDTVGTQVLTSSTSTPNNDYITMVDWGNVTTKKTGGLSITPPTLTLGSWLNMSVSWNPTSTVVSSDGPKTYYQGDNVCGVKIPFVEALNAPGDQYSITVTKNAVSPESLNKISGVVFNFSIGFAVSDINKLGTGTLVASCIYN